MGDQLRSIRAAVVQASSCFLDREASVRKAVRLIEEAGAMGAELVVFPEGFIPTHPVWFHFHAASSRAGREMAQELFRNAVVIGGAETELLAQASRRARLWTVMGVCEKRANTTGTMWNSAVYFSPDATVAAVHRKLTPTSGERLVHMGGDSEGLQIPRTGFGPVSSLICAENFNPLLVFTAMAQYAVVHAALWPSHFNTTSAPMRDVILSASRAIAFQSGCYVLSAAGTPDPESIHRVGRDETDFEWLRDARNLGGSCIVGPNGDVLAGPAGPEEVVLTAELDLDKLVGRRLVHDFAGHYNRADIFSLSIRPTTTSLLQAPWWPAWAPLPCQATADESVTGVADPVADWAPEPPGKTAIGAVRPPEAPQRRAVRHGADPEGK